MGIECYYGEHSAAQTAGYVGHVHAPAAWSPPAAPTFTGPKVRAAQLGTPAIPLAVWKALQAKAAEARAHRPE